MCVGAYKTQSNSEMTKQNLRMQTADIIEYQVSSTAIYNYKIGKNCPFLIVTWLNVPKESINCYSYMH